MRSIATWNRAHHVSCSNVFALDGMLLFGTCYIVRMIVCLLELLTLESAKSGLKKENYRFEMMREGLILN